MPESLNFLRRVAVVATSSPNVAATTTAQQVQGPTPNLPRIDPTQALKVKTLAVALADPNGLARLTVFSFNVNLVLAPATLVRSWEAPISGAGFLIGQQGLRIGAEDDVLVYGTDFGDVAGSLPGTPTPGVFVLQLGADISNTGAVTSVNFSVSALIEIFQRRITPA